MVAGLLSWMLVAGLVAVAWPAQLGGRLGFVIVVGTSMEPTYRTGDLLLTWPERSYETGDVVTYVVPAGEPGAGGRVVHRVVATDADGYVTRGDNRDSVDVWRPAADDVVGSVRGRVPSAGWVLVYLRHPLLWAALVGVLVAWAVAGGADTRQPGGRRCADSGPRRRQTRQA